jgi:glycine cleavage system H protein
MNFPADLKYTKDHEWIRIEGDIAVVGITEYAQDALGDIVYVDIPTLGQAVEKGEVFGSVEAVKTVSDLYLPMDGTILELNTALEASPELVNSDPYGEGWMVRIQLSNLDDTTELLSAEEYSALIA